MVGLDGYRTVAVALSEQLHIAQVVVRGKRLHGPLAMDRRTLQSEGAALVQSVLLPTVSAPPKEARFAGAFPDSGGGALWLHCQP